MFIWFVCSNITGHELIVHWLTGWMDPVDMDMLEYRHVCVLLTYRSEKHLFDLGWIQDDYIPNDVQPTCNLWTVMWCIDAAAAMSMKFWRSKVGQTLITNANNWFNDIDIHQKHTNEYIRLRDVQNIELDKKNSIDNE